MLEEGKGKKKWKRRKKGRGWEARERKNGARKS